MFRYNDLVSLVGVDDHPSGRSYASGVAICLRGEAEEENYEI